MNDIYEISVPSVQRDWRGVRFKKVAVHYNVVPNCEYCRGFNLTCNIKKDRKYTIVIFYLYNSNAFPIYTDFVDNVAAIRSDGRQIDPLELEFRCRKPFEDGLRVRNHDTIMPFSTQTRIVIYDDAFTEDMPIVKLDYRGSIYSKYESCNWGYFSYDLKTEELLTNGSLEYIDRINKEHERRKNERLYSKPYKLISELEVLLYKRNELPQTYKDFVSLTSKASGKLKELEEANKLNKLGLDSDIKRFSGMLEISAPVVSPVFGKTANIRINKIKGEITPEEFEHYVAEHFSQNGYEVEVTRYSLDDGIDIIMKKSGKLYGVQCKCYAADRFVDTADMFHFLGALVNMRADGGFLVTTGKVTQKGYDIAAKNGINIITL